MKVATKVFDLCPRYYQNLSELAQAMGISVCQVYRVRSGKRNINQKFIVGALRAFPQFKFDELFYFAQDVAVNDRVSPAGVTSDTHQGVEAYHRAPATLVADGGAEGDLVLQGGTRRVGDGRGEESSGRGKC